MAAPEPFAEKSDSFPLHRGRELECPHSRRVLEGKRTYRPAVLALGAAPRMRVHQTYLDARVIRITTTAVNKAICAHKL